LEEQRWHEQRQLAESLAPRVARREQREQAAAAEAHALLRASVLAREAAAAADAEATAAAAARNERLATWRAAEAAEEGADEQARAASVWLGQARRRSDGRVFAASADGPPPSVAVPEAPVWAAVTQAALVRGDGLPSFAELQLGEPLAQQ
jgi:hypothetical protein